VISYNGSFVAVLPGYLSRTVYNPLALEDSTLSLRRGVIGGILVAQNVEFEDMNLRNRLFDTLRCVFPDCVLTRRTGSSPYNPAADVLAKSVVSLERPRVPAVAYKFGYDGEKTKSPKCVVTCEGIDHDTLILCILPKSPRNQFQSSDILASHFNFFDVLIKDEGKEVIAGLGELDWLNQLRANCKFFCLTLNTLLPAEVLLAITIYVIEVVDVLHERVACAHLIGPFTGKPRMREFWTSPPS
jgi:hypothetical protein